MSEIFDLLVLIGTGVIVIFVFLLAVDRGMKRDAREKDESDQ